MQYAEGIGSYVYIIFAVIYVIYSIIKAGKKVSQNRPQQTSKPVPSAASRPADTYAPPKKEDDLKKMLEDLLGEVPEIKIPERQKPQPKPQPVFSKPAPAKIAPHHPKKEKLTSQPAKPLATAKKAAPVTPHFVSHPEIVQKAFTEISVEETSPIDFDIREAVIYSEIMKRPNW